MERINFFIPIEDLFKKLSDSCALTAITRTSGMLSYIYIHLSVDSKYVGLPMHSELVV